MREERSTEGGHPGIARVIRIGSMQDADPDADYWLDKSDRERLRALELCRERCYGRAAVVGRLARVLELADEASR